MNILATAAASTRAQQRAAAGDRYPAAASLARTDPRAPAETFLDLGIGDAVDGRVAGNVASEDIPGSMEFARKRVGAMVVLVKGHTACGTVKGELDHAEFGHLTVLVRKVDPAVGATTFTGARSSTDPAVVGAVATKNVQRTMAEIPVRSPVLAELQESSAALIAGATYDLPRKGRFLLNERLRGK